MQVEQVPGAHGSRDQYTCYLVWARSTGGVDVPVTLSHRMDLMQSDGTNPCIMHA